MFSIFILGATAGFALSFKPETNAVEATYISDMYVSEVITPAREPLLKIETKAPVEPDKPEVSSEADVRTINREKYREIVDSNESLEQWLEFGMWTRNSEEIKAKAQELYDSEVVTFPDGSTRYFEPSEDPILDFVRKSLAFASSIDAVGKSETQIYYYQIPADEVLAEHKGVCDEASILWVSLARSQGIPARIVARLFAKTDRFYDPNNPLGAHAEAQVWLNYNGTYQWVNVDPTYGWLKWAANGEDITHKDTEWYWDIERW